VAAVAAFSAWAARRHGSPATKVLIAVAIAVPTLLVVYVVLGLVASVIGA